MRIVHSNLLRQLSEIVRTHPFVTIIPTLALIFIYFQRAFKVATVNDYYHSLPKLPLEFYDLRKEVCSEPQFMIILIKTHPANIDRRSQMRKHWISQLKQSTGGNQLKISYLFVVGGAIENSTLSNALDVESKQYNDILMAKFVDKYWNLPYKGAFSLYWASHYCTNAKYFMYMDDDTYVFMDLLAIILSRNLPKHFILCNVMYNDMITRVTPPWIAWPWEFAIKIFYPNYCIGAYYVMPISVANELFLTSERSEYYRLDDVYFTGLLREIAFNDVRLINGPAVLAKKLLKNPFKHMTRFLAVQQTEGLMVRVHQAFPLYGGVATGFLPDFTASSSSNAFSASF